MSTAEMEHVAAAVAWIGWQTLSQNDQKDLCRMQVSQVVSRFLASGWHPFSNRKIWFWLVDPMSLKMTSGRTATAGVPPRLCHKILQTLQFLRDPWLQLAYWINGLCFSRN